MRSKLQLRGLSKILAIVVASTIGGAAFGFGLGTLSGSKGSSARARTSAATTGTSTSTTPTGPATTATIAAPRLLVPRVQVLSARLGATSPTTGHARVKARVRVTNRRRLTPLKLTTHTLAADGVDIPLDAAARDMAGPLLGTVAAGASATGVLRFTLPAAVTQHLIATPRARLRIAGRTVLLKLTTGAGSAP